MTTAFKTAPQEQVPLGEAARRLGAHERQIRLLIERGTLALGRCGKAWAVPVADFPAIAGQLRAAGFPVDEKWLATPPAA